MQKLTADDPETKSADVIGDNVEALKDLFPDAFTEGKVDFEVLKQLLGGAVDERDEKYGLNWHGKRAARQLALTPSTGTLRPCPEESVDWDTTQNLMIEGDNLEVLKLLQKSYTGKVKLIYIDPPYNTGNDFVYPDDFRDGISNYLAVTGQADPCGARADSSVETAGRFHTTWLNMMLPRLRAARSMLTEDGMICISIDDAEVARMLQLCDEVFGEENHLSTIIWQKRYVSNVTAKHLSDMHDFIVVYAKNIDLVSVATWERDEQQLEAYKNPDGDERGPWRAQDLSASKPYNAGVFTIVGPTGSRFDPPPNRYWRCSRERFDGWLADNRIWWGVKRDARPMLKSFLSESDRGLTPHTWWSYEFAGHNKEATLELKKLFDGDSPFDTPKPVKLMARLLEVFVNPSDLVMDFFSGSGSLGHAALQATASGSPTRWIMVQLPEPSKRGDWNTLADITKDRLRRAGSAVGGSDRSADGVDLGFRVFKLDSSNIAAWEPDREDLGGSLTDAIEHLKGDRSEQDILFELLLKLGMELTVPIEARGIAGKTVYSVGAGTLLVCLAESVDQDNIESIGPGIVAWHKELDPAGDTTVVFRDSAFADDVAKTNLTAILEQHGLSTVRSL